MSAAGDLEPQGTVPPRPERLPATPTESGVAFDLMRAALFVLAAKRSRPIVITRAARDASRSGMLRVAYDDDDAIRIWVEDAPEGMRRGVAYLLAESSS